jgi:hypothetical protein
MMKIMALFILLISIPIAIPTRYKTLE